MKNGLIAALDIGKTHCRLSIIDAHSGTETWSVRRVNQRVDTSLGAQLDVGGIERWLIEALRSAPDRDRIGTIVPIAHGAAAVLLDAGGQILAAPDYEEARFESVSAEYEAERDPFTSTYSPGLPRGLNLGRQLFYLERCEPPLFAQVKHVLLYPQFWAWRLSGVMASEVTSLGCHSDLWQPQVHAFSPLAMRRGWDALFPPIQSARDVLGPASGPAAVSAGLAPECRVVCGIHDSNASYLRYLLSRGHERFAVISSGTWTVVMANQAGLGHLRAERDMLANVDAFGTAVATARFMGGREYEVIACTIKEPTLKALRNVIDMGAMAIPSFAAGGPLAAHRGQLLKTEGLDEAERAALATLYVALMSDRLIESLEADGNLIIDGPLAVNPLFGAVLASLRPSSTVWADAGPCATTAIGYLAGIAPRQEDSLRTVLPLQDLSLARYRNRWRQSLPNRPPESHG